MNCVELEKKVAEAEHLLRCLSAPDGASEKQIQEFSQAKNKLEAKLDGVRTLKG